MAAAALGGCGGEAAQQNQSATAKPAALQAGEYEVTGTVKAVRSTDSTTPATALKLDAALPPVRACVAADGAIDPAMFAEGKDSCKQDNAYVRDGRLNVTLNCQRPGNGGVMQLANGTFKSADAFEAEVLTSTYFSGTGDYAMTRALTAKRVGDCPAGKGAEG